MRSVISILICLALLVVLLRRKISVGKAMLISAIALGILLGVGPVSFWGQLCEEWTNKPFVQRTGYLFVSLTALVLLVNVIAEAMTVTGVNERLVPAMQAIFRSRRVAISVIPLMLGMLPSPGGIMLSAPMVREMGDRLKIERSRQAAINFYFRHLWEPIWPLFPAIPLIQGILGISARSIVLYNSLVIITGVVGGVIFLLLTGIPPKVKAAPKKPDPFHRHLKNFFHAF